MGGFKIEPEWDEEKERANLTKHSVAFALAVTVLYDPLSLTTFDETHGDGEDRWFTIGTTPCGECLIVVHTWSDVDGL